MEDKQRGSVCFFEDPEFRILFRPSKQSRIDVPSLAARALHEEIELKYFYEGTSTLLIGNETVKVEAGDLVVINPYEMHSTVDLGREGGQYRFLMIDPDFFLGGTTGGLDLRAMITEEGLAFRTLVHGDARIGDMMRRLLLAYTEKGSFWQLTVRAVMLELISLLLREYSERRSEEEQTSHGLFETVEPALRKIRNDYAETITLEGLAALCKVSKCHFCRVFRRVTGKSAMRYLTEYRLKIADLMLSGSTESVAVVSERCGFGDQTYFSRCYKAYYGVSPMHRRAARK